MSLLTIQTIVISTHQINMDHFYKNVDGFSSEEEQGDLLKTILDQLDVTNKIKIAEIGVYKGRGTAIWNVELINRNIDYEYFAIDHFLGSSEHQRDGYIDYYGLTLNNLFPILDKIKIIKNDSISESKNYPDEYFDVVYIDASHEYECVKDDIISWLPKVKKGGILCGDDYCVGWPQVVRAVDEVLGKVNCAGLISNQQWWIKK